MCLLPENDYQILKLTEAFYFSYAYELSSVQAYRMVKPKELREMYPACHTMDCAQAIERILEAKDISFDMSIEKQYQVFRRIRKGA